VRSGRESIPRSYLAVIIRAPLLARQGLPLSADGRDAGPMKITYDTETDSISSPDLDAAQTAALQSALVGALARNEPVRDVARLLLQTAKG
jgi:hypothetical protein